MQVDFLNDYSVLIKPRIEPGEFPECSTQNSLCRFQCLRTPRKVTARYLPKVIVIPTTLGPA